MAGMNVAELFFTVAGKLNTKAFDDLDKKVGRSQKKISSLGKGFSFKGAVGGMLTGLGGAVAINQLIETGKELDSINKKFLLIGGSQEKANILLKQSRDLAFKLGLPLNDMQTEMGNFLAGGMGGKLKQPELVKTYEDMSFAIAGLGLPAEKTQRIFKALSQMLGKGKIQAEELTGQLGESMPGAAPQTAKALGIMQSALFDMMKQGELTSDYLPKIAAQFKKAYGGNALQNVKGMNGSIENVNNSFIELQRVLLQSGIGEIIVDIATAMSEIFGSQTVKNGIATIGKGFKDLFHELKKVKNEFKKLNKEIGTFETGKIFGLILILVSGLSAINKLAKSGALLTFFSPLFLFFAEATIISGAIYLLIEFLSLIKLLAEGKDISKMGGILMPLARWIRDTNKSLNDFLLLIGQISRMNSVIEFLTDTAWVMDKLYKITKKTVEQLQMLAGLFDTSNMDNSFAIDMMKRTAPNYLNNVGFGLGAAGNINGGFSKSVVPYNITVNQTNNNPTSTTSSNGVTNAIQKGISPNTKAQTQTAKQ